jgi:hypothetical protein
MPPVFASGDQMNDSSETKKIEVNSDGWPIFEVWKTYEDIAMHFNELLMRVRTQGLAAVAALATIIGIFAKSGADTRASWEFVAFAFAILALLWIAIWILDFFYYNRLLVGAVVALLELENKSASYLRVQHLNLSTKVENAVAGELPPLDRKTARKLARGRRGFYALVFLTLLAGFAYSSVQIATAPVAPKNDVPKIEAPNLPNV